MQKVKATSNMVSKSTGSGNSAKITPKSFLINEDAVRESQAQPKILEVFPESRFDGMETIGEGAYGCVHKTWDTVRQQVSKNLLYKLILRS